MKIAWIGTGVMGSAMACHLQKAGHEVKAYNRTGKKAEALQAVGTGDENDRGLCGRL